MIQSFEGRPVLAIYTIGAPAGARPVVVPSPDWIIADARWVKNDRIIMYLTKDKVLGFQYENAKRLITWGRAITISATGGDDAVPFRHDRNYANNTGIFSVRDVDLDDPDNIFIPYHEITDNLSPADEASNLRAGRTPFNVFALDMFRVNARTGDAEIFSTGSSTTTNWYMDGHGHVVARIDRDPNPLEDHVLAFRGADWHELGVFDASGDNSSGVEGVSEDGESLVRIRKSPDAASSLVSLNLSNGTETLLYSNPDYDVLAPIFDEWTGRVVGAKYVDDVTRFNYFGPQRMSLQRGIEQAFPNLTAFVISSDVAQNRVIVGVEGPRHPLAYYYLDRTTHQATEIGTTHPGLSESDLGAMKPYPYTARDGLALHAYLTLPPGKPLKNLPVVVAVHGGPDQRYSEEFNWWVAFMANRGYAVLQPNFRGSLGYGRKYLEAGFHQWGLKMQDDVTDGVDKLIADGIADPKRICIAGADYGGYSALAGATFTPGKYACAISISGFFDLPLLLAYERNRHNGELKNASIWEEFVGGDSGDLLGATSPDRHAVQVNCPVLLLHGDDDTSVPVAQSEDEEAALKAAGKSVRFVHLEGDDHEMRLAATRLQVLREIESFLAANIGN
jgi:dipeptidyl aminopeptidase/acylaminoacyl peptidase